MGFKRIMIALYTIVRRELVRTFRIWVGTLLSPAITTILYFIIFGGIIGTRVGEMAGYPYLTFIAPGLIMMSVISNAYSCSVSAFFGVKFHKDIDEMLITPMPIWVMLTGFMIGGMVRGVIVGFFVTLISMFFTHLAVHSVSVMTLVVFLSAAIFSLGGILNAIYAKTFDHISLIPTFVLTPLTYLGGVFYSISLLPPVWRHISELNPLVYIISTFRYGILGIQHHHFASSLLIMLVIFVVLFAVAHHLVRSGFAVRK